jgi:glycosyltransferase involved in cell wall biosynthesis
MNKKRKILIVSPIYSINSLGGAEKLALDYSNILSQDNEVTVLSTKSKNYQTWADDKSVELEKFESLNVVRFSVSKKRNIKKFNKFYEKLLLKKNSTLSDYNKFIELQGPFVPDLIDYIKINVQNFDFIFFIGYLYYPIVYGLPLCKEKAICVLALHDEPPAYFSLYRELFSNDLYYSFNTPEEKQLFEKIFNYSPKKSTVLGTYVELPKLDKKLIVSPKEKYLIYVGRMENGKGIYELQDYFLEFLNESNDNISLIFIGKGEYISPSQKIKYLGTVDNQTKYDMLHSSYLFINPSPRESFSISIMESWLLKIPVLVNANSDVMKNHCLRSNGGLYYDDYSSFKATLNYFLNNFKTRNRMGENGKRYVEMNYSYSSIKTGLEKILENF